jgi:hypothetical protein
MNSINQDSKEWEKIIDEAWANAKECPKCKHQSLLKLPSSHEIAYDGFIHQNPAEIMCIFCENIE